jgi:hypothetical protein
MNRPMRSAFTAAAGLSLALVALPARADHGFGYQGAHECERHGVPAPAAAYFAPPSPYAYAPAAPVAAPYRRAHWRGWEWRELRHEYRRLEMAHDRFYSTWDGNPWRRSRFERWYAARRAELDGRRAELDQG